MFLGYDDEARLGNEGRVRCHFLWKENETSTLVFYSNMSGAHDGLLNMKPDYSCMKTSAYDLNRATHGSEIERKDR